MSSPFLHNYFECVCGTPEHMLRFTTMQQDAHDGENEIYVEVFLNGYHAWYKRLWVALKYVLGVRQGCGAFDCTILSQDDANKLALLLSPELQSLQKTKAEVMKLIAEKNNAKS